MTTNYTRSLGSEESNDPSNSDRSILETSPSKYATFSQWAQSCVLTAKRDLIKNSNQILDEAKLRDFDAPDSYEDIVNLCFHEFSPPDFITLCSQIQDHANYWKNLRTNGTLSANWGGLFITGRIREAYAYLILPVLNELAQSLNQRWAAYPSDNTVFKVLILHQFSNYISIDSTNDKKLNLRITSFPSGNFEIRNLLWRCYV